MDQLMKSGLVFYSKMLKHNTFTSYIYTYTQLIFCVFETTSTFRSPSFHQRHTLNHVTLRIHDKHLSVCYKRPQSLSVLLYPITHIFHRRSHDTLLIATGIKRPSYIQCFGKGLQQSQEPQVPCLCCVYVTWQKISHMRVNHIFVSLHRV